MCEEADLKTWAKDKVLSRRQFGAITGAAALAACASGEGDARSSDGGDAEKLAVTESGVTFETADGTMDAFFVHPAERKHPAVVFWPDIASLREAKRNMARRLAGEGYAVLVLNPYYRDVAGEQFEDFAAWVNGGALEAVAPYRAKLDADSIGRDAVAAAAWLDQQASVDTDKGIGTQGYCMGGPFTVWSAAASDRIKAAASFHGGGLVRDDYDKSPHKVLDQTDAAFLIAVAQDDDEQAPDDKTTFADAAKAAGRSADVKVYEGNHGWTVPDAPSYAEAPAEEAYADLLALYSSAL
ncbi:MAG: dienelactone hydrolase family protein [Pseudomonadota bacterium]